MDPWQGTPSYVDEEAPPTQTRPSWPKGWICWPWVVCDVVQWHPGGKKQHDQLSWKTWRRWQSESTPSESSQGPRICIAKIDPKNVVAMSYRNMSYRNKFRVLPTFQHFNTQTTQPFKSPPSNSLLRWLVPTRWPGSADLLRTIMPASSLPLEAWRVSRPRQRLRNPSNHRRWMAICMF